MLPHFRKNVRVFGGSTLENLKQAILTRGSVRPGDIVKVDSFLNHQLDVTLLDEVAEEFAQRFSGQNITRILTCEASGIAIATAAARVFGVPAVFAKKTPSKNLDPDCYSADVYSYTRGQNYQIRVSKQYLQPEDRILIVDDFLANGLALLGMMALVEQAEAQLIGCGIVIEKGFQPGGAKIRASGTRLESLAIIDRIENGQIVFAE